MDRRATIEEIQYIKNIENSIRTKYSIPQNRGIFGKPMEEIRSILNTINIEYYYECYEIYCLNKNNINQICDFYSVEKLNDYSDEFSKNFIAITIANAEDRHNESVMNNLSDFYRFSEKYMDGFTKLSNFALDYNSDNINIPSVEVEQVSNNKGDYYISVKNLD